MNDTEYLVLVATTNELSSPTPKVWAICQE